MTSEFGKSLLDAAKTLDVPVAGAKARAIDVVASAATTAATTAAANGAIASAAKASGAKLGALAWSLVAAAAIGGGAAGFGAARATEKPPSVAGPRVAAEKPAPAPPAPAPAPPGATSADIHDDDAAPSGAPPNACGPIADAPPAKCSQGGKPVSISLKNGCAGDADVFWVDYKCREVFHARLPPGESFQQITQDAHVWRVRDHATHALLKEFVPQRVPGAPELVRNAPRRPLPDVVVHPADAAKDDAPLACSGAGMPTRFTLKNEREGQIVVMWIGLDCREKYWKLVEPKRSIVIDGVDADAWRIRDAATGEVVTDLVPEAPDSTTYVTVP